MSPNTLTQASVSQTPPVNFKAVMYPSLGPSSSSLAYSRALCLRNSTRWTSVGAWSWQFGNSKDVCSIISTHLCPWPGDKRRKGANDLSQGTDCIICKRQKKHGQLSESVPHRTMPLLTFNYFRFLVKILEAHHVPSKFTSCVIARTHAIGLSPSPYRVTCMAEEDRNKYKVV